MTLACSMRWRASGRGLFACARSIAVSTMSISRSPLECVAIWKPASCIS